MGDTDTKNLHTDSIKMTTSSALTQNVVFPVMTATFITAMMVLSLGAAMDTTVILYTLWLLTSQLIPWFTFLSYSSNKNSFQSMPQKLSLCAAWFFVYVLWGSYILYLSPAVIPDTWFAPKYVLQLSIAGLTLNHTIRILAVLVGDDWFALKNISTPCQAMNAFNASAVIIYKDEDNKTNPWMKRLKAFCSVWCQVLFHLTALKVGAYLYHIPEIKSFVDAHPILYYELSAIYTAIGVDFLVNRVNWIYVLMYAQIDCQLGMNFPVLSSSPRDFWRRETIHQREALKLGILKPVLKATQSYWLAVVLVFVGNFVVHTTFTFQVTLTYFAMYEWALIFVILFAAVGFELFVEKVVLIELKLQHVKETMFYKTFWFMVLHMTMASVVYVGVPKLVPMGLESSFWWLDNSW